MATLEHTLAHAVTAYDRRQSSKRCYNVYALGQYLIRVDEVCADIARGAEPIAAIQAGFHGPLLAFILKTVAKAHPNLPPAPPRPSTGLTYQPLTR